MLRQTALFLHRDTIGEDQRLAMLRGLAALRMECPGVRAGDYGDDLFGGSAPLRAVPPWKRTPRWRARREGPPCNYDVALHLDFEDDAALARYLAGEYAPAAASRHAIVPEVTARVHWRYDGEPLVRRGCVRHSALFVWTAEAGAAARSRALAAARSLADAPGVLSAATGENAGGPAAHFDWILDVQLRDPAAARGFVEGPQYAGAIGIIASATRHEWTARITHVMRGY